MKYDFLVRAYTYNTALSNGFFIPLELYKRRCNVKVAWIFNSQSHVPVLPKQLEHEVVTHICNGLTETPPESCQKGNLNKETVQLRSSSRTINIISKNYKCITISYCCIASSSFSSLNKAFPSIFLLSAAPILSSTVMSPRAFPYERQSPQIYVRHITEAKHSQRDFETSMITTCEETFGSNLLLWFHQTQ